MIRGVGPYSALITPKPGHSSTLFSRLGLYCSHPEIPGPPYDGFGAN